MLRRRFILCVLCLLISGEMVLGRSATRAKRSTEPRTTSQLFNITSTKLLPRGLTVTKNEVVVAFNFKENFTISSSNVSTTVQGTGNRTSAGIVASGLNEKLYTPHVFTSEGNVTIEGITTTDEDSVAVAGNFWKGLFVGEEKILPDSGIFLAHLTLEPREEGVILDPDRSMVVVDKSPSASCGGVVFFKGKIFVVVSSFDKDNDALLTLAVYYPNNTLATTDGFDVIFITDYVQSIEVKSATIENEVLLIQGTIRTIVPKNPDETPIVSIGVNIANPPIALDKPLVNFKASVPMETYDSSDSYSFEILSDRLKIDYDIVNPDNNDEIILKAVRDLNLKQEVITVSVSKLPKHETPPGPNPPSNTSTPTTSPATKATPTPSPKKDSTPSPTPTPTKLDPTPTPSTKPDPTPTPSTKPDPTPSPTPKADPTPTPTPSTPSTSPNTEEPTEGDVPAPLGPRNIVPAPETSTSWSTVAVIFVVIIIFGFIGWRYFRPELIRFSHRFLGCCTVLRGTIGRFVDTRVGHSSGSSDSVSHTNMSTGRGGDRVPLTTERERDFFS